MIDLAECFDDRLRWIGGRGENFQHARVAGVIDPNTVRKGAAGIDGDAERLGVAGHGVERRRLR